MTEVKQVGQVIDLPLLSRMPLASRMPGSRLLEHAASSVSKSVPAQAWTVPSARAEGASVRERSDTTQGA